MPTIVQTPLAEAISSASYLEAALHWFGFGYAVIPIAPRTKVTATPWDPWLTGLNETRIRNYWAQCPDHEVGFILDESCIVFDADSPESLAVLQLAEREFGLDPLLTGGTKRGEHHHFRLPDGIRVRTTVHCTKEHPNRVDIKGARSMVVLSPSTDKTILRLEVRRASELTVATREFIEALGGGLVTPPAPVVPVEVHQANEAPRTALHVLRAYLLLLDPDMQRNPWFSVGAALHHETFGSAQGYALYDEWSARGKKYKGKVDTRKVWSSIVPGHAKPATVGTLRFMLRAAGHNWFDIPVEADDVAAGEDL